VQTADRLTSLPVRHETVELLQSLTYGRARSD